MQVSLRLRSGIAASSRWQIKPRYGFAVASQWLRSVFTPTMQASLGIAVASQRLHAVYTLCIGFICSVFALRSNLGFGSASQWHHSVFTL